MEEVDPNKYTRNKTNRAGDALRNSDSSDDDKNNALKVLSHWRYAHIHPMNVFKNRLERVSQEMDKKSFTGERLKRVPSIIKKLNRFSMRLTQMQDIAGCRAIVSDVKTARKLYEEHYAQSSLKHRKIKEHDYITEPKSDGYRSIHLVYKFKSDKPGKTIYNDLLVEVQIRSKLQHLWATAVETVGFFMGQAIKSNEGEEDWNEFFKLISSAFAKFEGCPIVENTPNNEKELYLAIKKKEEELKAIRKMEDWANSIRQIINFKDRKYFRYYLLELDTIQRKILVTAFPDMKEEHAIDRYAEVEKRIFNNKDYDAVLVGAETIEELKEAYPNYFLDTREFIKYLKEIINKCSDEN